ncbi:glycosyl hydrolase [Telluria mixta]|uniref:Glycosyl hydrolase n=1 Tax=Telluria mixta TaxID=34071 RepID=A0ABT2BYN9_9BURK|nr:glycosyl hydrolase [Telluria mixta]MCS0630254.1 glycosyl hydrolase [Telluria mixta]WEM94437.1 glycosyl hydrolase [Telluria mixta]
MRLKSICLLFASLPCVHAAPLFTGFVSPPDTARPRTWWHWMDGNVSPDGIRQDLAWMKRVGLGGLQQIDASLQTPRVVRERVVYGSAAWQANMRLAAAEAERLGLEFGIASSPGWSLTGGPWVRPEQAMKKIVWSETAVEGGTVAPPPQSPPSVAGPFQDLSTGVQPAPAWYRDIAVLALPAEAPAPRARRVRTREGADVGLQLSDGRIADSVQLAPDADRRAWIDLDYGQPATFRALTLALPAPHGFGAPPPPEVVLQASEDGERYTDVAPVALSTAPRQTVDFAPRTARWWRVLLKAGAEGGAPPAAPGVLLPPFGQPARSYPVAEVTLHTEPRVHRVEEKAGFAAASDYYALDTPADARGVPLRDVIDLTSRLRPDGTLDWTAPPGRWTVLRFGYSLTGKENAPAPAEGTGLEVDKLNAGHVARYMDTYLGRVRAAVGPDLLGRRGVRALLNDSIESGFQNWTDGMQDAFAARRGYSPIPWLPVLTGRIVGDGAASDRFLWDLRRTIADLYADGHYATVARGAHAADLTVYGEALEDNRPQLGDDLDLRAHADVPMGAMWTVPHGGQPRPTFVADLQGAASVAHVRGRTFVAAESMTAFGQPWGFAPRDLKKTADIEFALGVNRIVIHTSAHQPQDGVTPGMTLAPFLGQYFSRHETWADVASPWIDYLARTSFMLQQGRNVADVAYFYGEEAPITGLFGATPNRDVPAGYGFDYVNPDVLQQQLRVVDGQLASCGGARYRVLYLGGSSDRMTVATLRRIAALARAGATVVGKRPAGSPSLADSPSEFARLADQLWGSTPATRRVGLGTVVGTGDLQDALTRTKAPPALRLDGRADGVMTLQRHTPTHEVYFVANTGDAAREVDALFRDGRGAPEIWHPDSACVATTRHARGPDGIRVPLRLDAGESLFVVFPRGGATPGLQDGAAALAPWMPLDGGWRLAFQPGRGAPEQALELDRLAPWNTSDIPGVRYFSGTATYRKTFRVDGPMPARAILDLGDVRDLARVSVNGRPVGIAWKPPYRFDLRNHLRPGDNQLDVEVTNLWVNRLIGDAQPGAASVTQASGIYAANAPLRDSGMLGPVRLMTAPMSGCVDGVAR